MPSIDHTPPSLGGNDSQHAQCGSPHSVLDQAPLWGGAAEGLRGQHGHEPGVLVHLGQQLLERHLVRGVATAFATDRNRVNIGPDGGDPVQPLR